ncbi:MAG: hypothetical protein H6842_15345 [Rhodospirillaceae bacterium]|nr:hypothetical protein [Rhodospirillaceae bacterium]
MIDSKIDEIRRERDELAAQIRSLQDQLAGLDKALAILRREERAPHTKPAAPKPVATDAKPPAPRRSRRSGGPRPRNQSMVMDMLAEAGEQGMSVSEVLAAGASRGTPMARASISSLLSRLKREGKVASRDGRYALIEGG